MVTESRAKARASTRQGAADEEAKQIGQGIGAAVEAFRLGKGWSRQELAREAGLDRSAVFKIEKGQRRPNPGTIAQLAAALETTVTQLSAAAYVAAAGGQEDRRRRAAAGAGVLAAASAVSGLAAVPVGLAAVPVMPALLGVVAATKIVERGRRQRSGRGGSLTRDDLFKEVVARIATLDATELEALLAILPERNAQARM